MTRELGWNWQPIDTAPKDGTPVLFHVSEAVQGWSIEWLERLLGVHVAVAAWMPSGDATEFGWVTVMTALAIAQGQIAQFGRVRVWPTHWMPLPPPPGGAEPGRDFVDTLPISARAKNVLRHARVRNAEDLVFLVETTPDRELLRWPKVGRGIVREIRLAASLLTGTGGGS